MADEEVVLSGGLINTGAVVRVGDTVRRPVRPASPAVWELFAHLEAVGFAEAPRFLGLDEQGREILSYIPGEVGLPPFPAWVADETALTEAARLLARYHDAVAGFSWASTGVWSDELADLEGAELVCHNDVCVENVVYREGRAVGLVDFDFAAPGRRIWDVAMAARMWAPLTHPSRRVAWPGGLEAGRRLGVFARAYGLDSAQAETFLDAVLETRQVGTAFVRRRAEAGEVAFQEMWDARGGDERALLDDRWIAENRRRFLDEIATRLGS